MLGYLPPPPAKRNLRSPVSHCVCSCNCASAPRPAFPGSLPAAWFEMSVAMSARLCFAKDSTFMSARRCKGEGACLQRSPRHGAVCESALTSWWGATGCEQPQRAGALLLPPPPLHVLLLRVLRGAVPCALPAALAGVPRLAAAASARARSGRSLAAGCVRRLLGCEGADLVAGPRTWCIRGTCWKHAHEPVCCPVSVMTMLSCTEAVR